LKVYDAQAGRKKAVAGGVRMLLCGPTVYDYSHVGHVRMLLFYDLFARYCRHKGQKISAVVTITDIDPKIFARARMEDASPQEIAGRFIGELLRDAAALGIDGFAFAKVSDHIDVAKTLARQLLAEGKAYSASGNVYLDVSKAGFGGLSKMSRKDFDDCRLDIAPGKRSPSDILLWNGGEQFDVRFEDSVLGAGIPWWHMQDTSVAMASFNGVYDVHGGADELVYPHHESHLAQLQALTGKREPVKAWTHTGLVYVNGKKMAKSLGNTVTIRDLLKKYSANAVRLYLLSRHYRDRFDYDEKEIEKFEQMSDDIAGAPNKSEKLPKDFVRCIEDDFDTPGALDIMRKAIRARKGVEVMARVFGLR
jgi:cysteinyl-tRNA synthetase